MPLGMVAGTYQRTALDEVETHLQTCFAIMIKEIRMDKLLHRQVVLGGLQILTEGQYVTAMLHQILHQFAGGQHLPE